MYNDQPPDDTPKPSRGHTKGTFSRRSVLSGKKADMEAKIVVLFYVSMVTKININSHFIAIETSMKPFISLISLKRFFRHAFQENMKVLHIKLV